MRLVDIILLTVKARDSNINVLPTLTKNIILNSGVGTEGKNTAEIPWWGTQGAQPQAKNYESICGTQPPSIEHKLGWIGC